MQFLCSKSAETLPPNETTTHIIRLTYGPLSWGQAQSCVINNSTPFHSYKSPGLDGDWPGSCTYCGFPGTALLPSCLPPPSHHSSCSPSTPMLPAQRCSRSERKHTHPLALRFCSNVIISQRPSLTTLHKVPVWPNKIGSLLSHNQRSCWGMCVWDGEERGC